MRERIGLRVTDREAARVVRVHSAEGRPLGAGCLVSSKHILTCKHLDGELKKDDKVRVKLIGVTELPVLDATVQKVAAGNEPLRDLALLELCAPEGMTLDVPEVEFATPLRHGGKAFAVMGFPATFEQGSHAVGCLRAPGSDGLIRMDNTGTTKVQSGFSGAPVWSPDVGAFVGLVVTELEQRELSWCIPSRIIADFWPDLIVRFRIPISDRPTINDYSEDEPNRHLFGSISDDGERRLSATVRKGKKVDYVVEVKYQCLEGSRQPKGRVVTFVTHPSFTKKHEDAYELYSMLTNGVASNEFYPDSPFVVAAIGDAGDTALTLDLSTVENKPASFR